MCCQKDKIWGLTALPAQISASNFHDLTQITQRRVRFGLKHTLRPDSLQIKFIYAKQMVNHSFSTRPPRSALQLLLLLLGESVVADVAVAAVGTGVAQLATALLCHLQSYVRGREGWVQMRSTCLTTSLPRPHCSTLVVCWPKLATTT